MLFLCFICFSCKTGSIITYENNDFNKTELNHFKINEDVYITADIKYVGDNNYGLIFHVYSSRDFFENITLQSLKLKDENNILLFEKDSINILIHNNKSFFDSVINLYQRSFLISDYYLTNQEIQMNKKFYILEYSVNEQKKMEKLTKKEDKYIIPSI